jgi:hypothetical protein
MRKALIEGQEARDVADARKALYADGEKLEDWEESALPLLAQIRTSGGGPVVSAQAALQVLLTRVTEASTKEHTQALGAVATKLQDAIDRHTDVMGRLARRLNWLTGALVLATFLLVAATAALAHMGH